MAIDQIDVALDLCSALQNASAAIMQGVEIIVAVRDQKESAGIDFAAPDFVAALEKSALKHASGDTFNSVISSGVALKSWMESNFHDDNFQKVRGGRVLT